MYTLKIEKNELADRANQRQTGTVPRHKVRAISAATERNFLGHCVLTAIVLPFYRCFIELNNIEEHV